MAIDSGLRPTHNNYQSRLQVIRNVVIMFYLELLDGAHQLILKVTQQTFAFFFIFDLGDVDKDDLVQSHIFMVFLPFVLVCHA